MSRSLRSVGDFNLGDVIIKSVATGRSIDITATIQSIDIYEDIEASFMSGVITMIDLLKIGSNLPLIANEIITLNLSTDSDPSISGDFFVYKVGKREEITSKLFRYSLYIISIEALFDLNTVMSAPFSGKPHEIAEQMVRAFYLSNNQQLQKNYIFEESINETNFVPNFWHPKQCLEFLCEHSINEKGDGDYLFYENRNGFNFTSLSGLVDLKSKKKIIDYSFIKTDNIDFTLSNNSEYQSLYKNVILLSVPESNDYIKNVSKGVYGSLMFAFDTQGQNLFGNVYDPREQYKDITYLNPYPIISPMFLSEPAGTVLNRTFAMNTYDDLEDSSNTTWIQHRISRLGALKNQKTNIIVYGRTLYTIGKIANLLVYDSINSENSLNNEVLSKSIDSVNSGNYIVAKIGHHFDVTENEYTCDIELWKDSLIVNHITNN